MSFISHEKLHGDLEATCGHPKHKPSIQERLKLEPGIHTWECPQCQCREVYVIQHPPIAEFMKQKDEEIAELEGELRFAQEASA